MARTVLPVRRFLILAAGLILAPFAASAVEVKTDIQGISGEILDNVRAHLSLYRAMDMEELSVWRLRSMTEDARTEVAAALEPFGFYLPRVEVNLDEGDAATPWLATVRVQPGQPAQVNVLDLEIGGPGADLEAFRDWRDDWPLPEDAVFDHATYESARQSLERLARRQGFFDGRFTTHRVHISENRLNARITLHFETGQRWTFDTLKFPDLPLSNNLMQRLIILEPGDPVTTQALERQREVLVRSGYFDHIVMHQSREPKTRQVHLDFELDMREPNTYKATLGFGTDTGPRTQLEWVRHYLSRHGDRLNLGFGAQQQHEEFVLRGRYQRPRGHSPDMFWTAGGLLKRERNDFSFIDADRQEAIFDALDGTREQTQLTLGRLQDRRAPFKRYGTVSERLFVAWLHESYDALRESGFNPEQAALIEQNPELPPFLRTSSDVLTLGAEWDMFNISGTGFSTRGEHFKARVLSSLEELGSDVSFVQGWLSGRWHWLINDRHKLLLRGEIGYTRAETTELDLTLDDRELRLSITELPELYRFKTGGDRSVRGYGYEDLSTNRNGANHIITASAEYEYRVGENWSLASFVDMGNAFNDDTAPDLKRGVGVGFRWYTAIGPVQLDLARALDIEGRPWRLHFTIGTPLL